MKRGGHGYQLQAPWGQHINDKDPTESAAPPEHIRPRRRSTFRWLNAVITVIASSAAVVLLTWSLQRRRAARRDLQGIVFPLYHYYHHRDYADYEHQLPNASGGGEMGHRSSRASHNRRRRGLRQAPFFELREKLYIEMKLGAQAKTFNFDIDTGSRHTWVYCQLPGQTSVFEYLGPHGMFLTGLGTVVKCNGAEEELCDELQREMPDQACTRSQAFHCLLYAKYADDSEYKGSFVFERVRLPTRRSELQVNAKGVFGCIVNKKFDGEGLPIFHDGLFGLGNCKLTLVEQWKQLNVIEHNVVVICIAQAVKRGVLGTQDSIGYVALGNDYKEKFSQSNVLWAKLSDDDGLDCAVAVSLLFLIFNGKTIFPANFPSDVKEEIFVLDTGSDVSLLDAKFFDPLVHDIVSPVHSFPDLAFALEGMPSDPRDDQIRYLTVRPENYLDWQGDTKKLCVHIICACDFDYGESILGSGALKGKLFVIDYDNQRIRWQSSACDQ